MPPGGGHLSPEGAAVSDQTCSKHLGILVWTSVLMLMVFGSGGGSMVMQSRGRYTGVPYVLETDEPCLSMAEPCWFYFYVVLTISGLNSDLMCCGLYRHDA